MGFGAVLSHRPDGISRGSGALVLLGTEREHKMMVLADAAHVLSFRKGSSGQDYPSSLMGSIALLRQTYLDGAWYAAAGRKEEYNASLEAWNKLQSMPQVFEARDWLEELAAIRMGREHKAAYILKGNGTEYRRIDEFKLAAKQDGAQFVLPLNYPAAFDVDDPFDAMQAGIDELKHWELAPRNAAALAAAGIPFAFTVADLKTKADFLKNLRKSVKLGLTPTDALRALTATPASMLHAEAMLGSLEKGKLANFVIASGDLFDEKTVLYDTYIIGKAYFIAKPTPDLRGTYSLVTEAPDSKTYTLEVTGTADKPVMKIAGDTAKINVAHKLNYPLLSFSFVPIAKGGAVTLSGSIATTTVVDGAERWVGTGNLSDGTWIAWSATRTKPYDPTTEKKEEKKDPMKDPTRDSVVTKVTYPFVAFGNTELPKVQTVLVQDATVWTNEKEGIIEHTDVVLKGGKIVAIGKHLPYDIGTILVDGKGKHLTAGIIDEHSHIGILRGVNEGTQAVTAEVRIGDVLNPEDINIYRQLAGGVTTSHLLHGSANPIGGQTQVIKMRWGYAPEAMKFATASAFIKFALGENVKQANWGDNSVIRYPQTRMGVEQTMRDAFTRAREYAADKSPTKRRDIELDALVEILNKKRFVTCHSYVQSEILMMMQVADDFGFTLNTFTHILEGYKVAKQMKKHGANASTFADWWAYKMEVQDAIPYNAALLHREGINVGINSDDAEMGRRLNQEAAKTVQFGGVSEEEAWKMVTLNPAKMLHIESQVGSVKVGKDADVVLWSGNPLSVYSRAETTWVDGIRFYDRHEDDAKRVELSRERARLIQKMLKEKADGKPTQTVVPKKPKLYTCDTVEVED